MNDMPASYTPSNLQFVSSMLFFQWQKELLQKIGFFSIASDDIYYKYSFQKVAPYYFIQWCEYEWITVEHKIYEQWIIYKLWFMYPKYQNVQRLTVDLMNSTSRSMVSTKMVIKSYPWIEWGILLLILGFLPYWLSKWLFRLNLVWICLFILVSLKKILFFYYNRAFKTKKSEYWWLLVNYQVPEDTLFLSPDVISTLRKLPELQITKFCYTWNCMYFFQDIHEPKMATEFEKIVFTSRLYTESEKAELQQRTISFFEQPDFISQFSRY